MDRFRNIPGLLDPVNCKECRCPESSRKIMKKSVKDILKIKASGGIRDAETAYKYIEIGVHRIGASSGVAMMTNQTSHSTY